MSRGISLRLLLDRFSLHLYVPLLMVEYGGTDDLQFD